MLYRFRGVELDLAARQLRLEGTSVPLQPQAFAVLQYLIEHRERVVGKDELLERLWPGVRVSDASVQRAVSLARAALGARAGLIQTQPKQGYRFVGKLEREAGSWPVAPAPPPSPLADAGSDLPPFRPSFARSGDVFIAYHTVGEGPLDLVLVSGWVFPMSSHYELRAARAALEELTRFGRVILFDKRGTGLSDRVQALPTFEQRVDDLRAVLDEVGSSQAVLVGISEGGPLCMLFSSLYPERTRALILATTFARWPSAPDHPFGWPPAQIARLREYVEESWGRGDTIAWGLPSRATDREMWRWAARAEQLGASPGAALQLLEMNFQIDVRPLLSTISVPTAVLHARGDPVLSIDHARHLAARIRGARLIELSGEDHLLLGADRSAALRGAIEWALAQPRQCEARFLTTVLAASGAARGARLEALDAIALRFRGRRATAGAAWSFDGPQRALHCGSAMARSQAGGLGVHTGEVEGPVGRLAGGGVETARALARSAEPGQVLASAVVRDLVHGSRLAFEEFGFVTLPGGQSLRALVSRSDE